jgi:Leucine-rich repeat (LRR) protein
MQTTKSTDETITFFTKKKEIFHIENLESNKYAADFQKYFVLVLVTLFQVPQYEHLQILICNGNSLTTLAGVEHIKHLWKLDVGNNQVLLISF